MGVFDFLKPAKKTESKISKPVSQRSECDISKTQLLTDLFATPKQNRNEEWNQSFLANVKTASFACGNPQVFAGPDGFPYFVLKMPKPNTPFESFCINNMKDDFLLEKGFGVAINPTENAVDWVFSYGDIVNLHINKEFFTTTDNVIIQNEEIIKEEEKVLIAQPSENYFPGFARQQLKLFLQTKGIKKPKLMMVCRRIGGEVIQELAFNIFAEDFTSKDQLNNMLREISWFLPRHYIILSLPKDSNLNDGFDDL